MDDVSRRNLLRGATVPVAAGSLGQEADARTPAFGRVARLASLRIGAPADLSLIEIVEGPVDFVRTHAGASAGSRRCRP
jgi:dihydroorotase